VYGTVSRPRLGGEGPFQLRTKCAPPDEKEPKNDDALRDAVLDDRSSAHEVRLALLGDRPGDQGGTYRRVCSSTKASRGRASSTV